MKVVKCLNEKQVINGSAYSVLFFFFYLLIMLLLT